MNKIARELGKTIKKDGMANVPGVTIHSGWRSTARYTRKSIERLFQVLKKVNLVVKH